MTSARHPFRDAAKESRYRLAAKYMVQVWRDDHGYRELLSVREAFANWYANADEKKFKDPAIAWAYYRNIRGLR